MLQIATLYVSVLLVLSFTISARASPLNTTALLPDLSGNFSNHGNPNLLCRPARWSDVVAFYLGNYLAHAATIRNRPGASVISSIFTVLVALLFPTSGVMSGLRAILISPISAETELQTAARAGALCMVVREKDGRGNRQDGQQRKSIALLSTKIHGSCVLPPGYGLAIVPGKAEFENDSPRQDGTWWRRWLHQIKNQFKPPEQRTVTIASNYNIVKICVSLGQSLYAITTLYRTRGDQINRYGFAAFGLTVTPYAFMSFVNLLGNFMCPEYPAMYLVESRDMRELTRRSQAETQGSQAEAQGSQAEAQGSQAGAQGSQAETQGSQAEAQECDHVLEGIVGKLKPAWEASRSTPVSKDGPINIQDRSAYYRTIMLVLKDLKDLKRFLYSVISSVILLIAIGAVPISIIGGLSGFRKASSTHAQRVWTMTWLAFGIFLGVGIESSLIRNLLENRERLNRRAESTWKTLYNTFGLVCFYATPAIGGFVVVGQMLLDYGICIRVD